MGFVHLFNECATDGSGERGFAQAARNDDYLFINDVEANGANLRFMPFEITLDVNEPEKMIKFWTTVLNYELRDAARYHDANQRYWSIADPTNNGPRIIIQSVPEPVTSKTRFHIDICSDDLDADANRAIALGAKRVDTEPMNEVGATWVRMLDPEGNPFCFALNREK